MKLKIYHLINQREKKKLEREQENLKRKLLKRF